MKTLKIFILIFILSMAFNYGMDLILNPQLDDTFINIKNFFQGMPISEGIFFSVFVGIFLVHIYSLSVKRKN